jgi:hypothetical protein
MSNKHYIYFDSYVNITKYEKFLDEFIRNIIIKNEFIINKNLCYDKNCSKNALYNIALFAKASNDIYKANIKTNCIKKNLYISKSVKNIILKLCNYSDYYIQQSKTNGDSKGKKKSRLSMPIYSKLFSKLSSKQLQLHQGISYDNIKNKSLNILQPSVITPNKSSNASANSRISSWSKDIRHDNSEDYNMCLHSDEIIVSIKFSYLVINNITSNLLLFFGFMANCELKDKRNKNILKNDVDESIILSSYINGTPLSTLKKKLNIRQVFEVFYTIICCFYYYGYCIEDINLGNFLTNDDSFYTCITIDNDNIFYFPIYGSITIIDYQISTANIVPIINIKKYIRGLSNLIDKKVLHELLKINNGKPKDVLSEFAKCSCFQKYKVLDKSIIGRNSRNIIFRENLKF